MTALLFITCLYSGEYLCILYDNAVFEVRLCHEGCGFSVRF